MSQGRRHSLGTLSVRAGQKADPGTGAHSTPIYQTATFVLGDPWTQGMPEAPKPVDTYSRAGNPTVRAVEQKLAALEGAEGAVAFGSGMAAAAAVMLAHLKMGDEVVYLGPLYGGTQNLLEDVLGRFGVSSVRVDRDEDLEAAIGQRARLVYVETPSNPTLQIHDLAHVATVARRHGLLSAADSTFASPYLSRPLEFGIDLVIHSATKYLGGHDDLLGGFVAGRLELLTPVRQDALNKVGATLDPHAAYLLLRGMRTLHLRMQAHCHNALAVARALAGLPGVSRVYYPGLETHPGHLVAARQMSAFGGVLAVEFAGGRPAAAAFVAALTLFDHAVSLGDAASLVCIPATSTHQSVAPEKRLLDGVTPGLVRLSVGIEDEVDLVADVRQAARAAAAAVAAG